MKRIFLLLFFLIPFFAEAQFGEVRKLIRTVFDEQIHEILPHDVDADGDIDVLAMTNSSVLWVENLDGEGNFGGVNRLFLTESFSGSVLLNFYVLKTVDLDNDGLEDIICSRSWARNLGNGTYEIHQDVFERRMNEIADVDGDGLLDVLTIRFNTPNEDKIFLHKNIGGGDFADPEIFIETQGIYFTASGDFDGDGLLDFSGYTNDDQSVWFRGLQGGGFDRIQFFDNRHYYALAVDFDLNGKMNLITTDYESVINYEFNPQSGIFEEKQVIFRSAFTGFLEFGNINGDSYPDLLVSQNRENGRRVNWFAGTDSGVFGAATTIVATNQKTFQRVKAADFDGDGLDDILGTKAKVGGEGVLHLNMGGGEFTGGKNLFLIESGWTEIDARDLDNDGDRDLIQWTDRGSIILENLGPEQLSAPRFGLGIGSIHSFQDLNGDSLQDVAFYSGDYIYWRENLGNLNFSDARQINGFVPQAEDVNGADLDGDGDIDLFAANGTVALPRQSHAWWFENDGAGNFTSHKLADTVFSIIRMEPIDVDVDGDLDLMMFGHDDEIDVFENLGNGNFGPRTVSSSTNLDSPDDIKRREIVDLDKDGDLDLVMSDFGWDTRHVFWYENNGDGTFQDDRGLITTGANSNANFHITFHTLDDFDNDGDLDVFFSGTRDNRFVYRENIGGGEFENTKTIYGTGGFTIDLDESTLCDIDHDGDLDPVWVESNGDNSQHWLYWMSDEPPPPNGFDVLDHEFSCDENETPDDASDDILFMTLNLSGNGLSDSFLIRVPVGTITPSFAPYDEDVLFEFSSGSVRNHPNVTLFINDDEERNINTTIELAAPMDSCSILANPEPAIREEQGLNCWDNSTPSDPSDDVISFRFLVQLYDAPPSDSFTVRSNFEIQSTTPRTDSDSLFLYGKEYFVLFEDGSASDTPLEITLIDWTNPQFNRTYTFDNPGSCSDAVSTVDFEEESLLSVYPNPFRGKAVFELKNSAKYKDCKIEIFDALGRKTVALPIANQAIFESKNTSGVFFYFLKNELGEVLESGEIFQN